MRSIAASGTIAATKIFTTSEFDSSMSRKTNTNSQSIQQYQHYFCYLVYNDPSGQDKLANTKALIILN